MVHEAATSSTDNRAGPPALRVLHLITRMDLGGSATNTAATCIRLAAEFGHHVTLAAGPSPEMAPHLAAQLREAGVTVITVPHLRRNPNPVLDTTALIEVLRLVRRVRPRVLHTHTSKAGVLGRFSGRLLSVPAVVHTPHGHVFYGYFGRLQMRFFVFLERIAARCCDRIVSLTERETADSLERGIGRPNQYVTIPSGVPLRQFIDAPPGNREMTRQSLGIAPDDLVFITVARLAPVKGVDILVEAWCRLGAAAPRLLVVGDGDERFRLETRVHEAGLAQRVSFLGARPDVPQLLHAADVFVLASRNEGMGRVYVEAMAAGLPVIGTDVGGVRCVVANGVTGLLIQPEAPEQLAAAVERLGRDSTLRQRLGRAGREKVYPEFDEAPMVERIARLYRQVLQARTRE